MSIKVCDVACGSGHILLNAARRIGAELTKIRSGEDQPSPEPLRKAVRDVIKSCIYGVDKNPLAVELCKVSLWLEAHNPGEPLNFLDHHIKCGDAIVGLAHMKELEDGIADEAFKKMEGDESAVLKALLKKNREERKLKETQFSLDGKQILHNSILKLVGFLKEFEQLPENSPEQISKKRGFYLQITGGCDWWQLYNLSNIKISNHFIPKIDDYQNIIVTQANFKEYLGGKSAGGREVGLAQKFQSQYDFFHWFLEFPEVFAQGGFDCVLGNPPFLGGQKISGTFGIRYLEYLKFQYPPARSCDIVTFFFRRIFDLLRPQGFMSLISTNTIAQGGARESGLDVILTNGGSIDHAVRSMPWPGSKAAVEVSLVTIKKGTWKGKRTLNLKPVDFISSYLDDSDVVGEPFALKQNGNKSFQGSIILGMGFVLTPGQARELIARNPKNKEVLCPYLNGDDLNSRPDQSPSRWVINFFDWPLARMDRLEWDTLEKKEQEKVLKEGIYRAPDDADPVARDYPECLDIVERLVKPERIRWKVDKNVNAIVGTYALRRPLPQKYWIYGEKRPALYRTIAPLERVMVTAEVTKYCLCSFADKNMVYMHTLKVFAHNEFEMFALLNSAFHDAWSWRYCSTMGGVGLRYTPSSSYETFPFIHQSQRAAVIAQMGISLLQIRLKILKCLNLGLTKTYNLFHNPNLTCEKIQKESKQPELIAKEAYNDIMKLRELHKAMDEAVLEAYCWHEDTQKLGPKIDLGHNFYEVEYLPENDRIRYTIHPDARKEILKRLLMLNHEIYAHEMAEEVEKKKGKTGKKAPQKKKIDERQAELF